MNKADSKTRPASESSVLVVVATSHKAGEEILRARCGSVHHVSADPNLIAAAIGVVDAVLVHPPAYLSADLIKLGRHLRVISASGAGFDSIDLDAATERAIPVLYVPGMSAPSMAEFVIGALVLCGRRWPELDRECRKPSFDWGRRTGDLLGVELRGRQLGIIGLGQIGRRLGQLASSALGMHVIAFDPNVTSLSADLRDVQLVSSLESLLETSDFVSVNVPLTKQTQGLIGPRQVARMKPGGCLINTSRGHVVDEAAVAAALSSGHIRFAAFDVFADELKIADSPLADAPNCVLSPHIGAITDRTTEEVAKAVAEGLVAALNGDFDPRRIVNPAVLRSS
jgi:D-3-phosphoglycerate dehydrogenase / 2-oxoglutarate reductase